MKKIKVYRIKPQEVDLYGPDGEFLASVNEYEFNDARVQIKELGLKGYYIFFEGQRIRIDSRGRLEKHPDGLFDTLQDLWRKLI